MKQLSVLVVAFLLMFCLGILVGCKTSDDTVLAASGPKKLMGNGGNVGQGIDLLYDKETGVEYLLYKCYEEAAMCVRVDSNGKPMIHKESESK